MQNSYTQVGDNYIIDLGVKGQLGKTLVDSKGFEIAKSYSGFWSKGGSGYALMFNNRSTIILHRAIFRILDNYFIDHINGDKLDNRLCNLQIASDSQNIAKSKIRSDNTTGYRGVVLNRRVNKYIARIVVNQKQISLGYFKTKEEAALAYNAAAKEYFGEFAYQNTIKKVGTEVAIPALVIQET